MNKLAPSVTTTQTTVVKLLPSVRRALLTELQAAQKEKIALKIAEEKWDRRKARIRVLREKTGENSLEIDGYTISNVEGTFTQWDEKKMLEAGLSIAQIESFKVVRPKKAYEKISFPAEKVSKRLLKNGDYGSD